MGGTNSQRTLVFGLGDAKGRARWSWRMTLGNTSSRGSSEQPRLPGEEAVGCRFMGSGSGACCLGAVQDDGPWTAASADSCRDAHVSRRRRQGRQNTVGRRHETCAKGGMSQLKPPSTTLPHHKLFAYELCLSLVKLVAKVRIADAQLRAQARKSAASAALNCAEGAARQTRADKSRAYAIALCECCEACAAIEIAGALGACSAADVQAVVALGTRAKNILSRLVR